MHKKLAPLIALSALVSCGSLPEDVARQPVNVGVGIGTMGLTVEPSYRAAPEWGVRVPIGFGKINRDVTVEGIDYAVSATTGGVGVMADYFPNGDKLRVSAGFMKSNLGATGEASGTIDVGAGTYAGVDLLAEVETARSIAPAISVGYEGVTKNGWGVSADLGAVFTGGFSASLTDTTGTVPQADIDAEVDSVEQSLNDYKLVPYLKLGMTYRW